MAKVKNHLTEETKSKLSEIGSKLMTEVVTDYFTKDEINTIKIAFTELTGRPPFSGCRGLCNSVLKLVQNYLRLHPLSEVTEPTEEKDLNDYTLAELKEMYPDVKARSKKEFISKIS